MKNVVFYTVLLLSFSCRSVSSKLLHRFNNEDVILASNQSSNKLVVLINGGGSGDIDESITFSDDPHCYYLRYKGKEIKPFKDLSDDLFNLGYSVLRYTKLSSRVSIPYEQRVKFGPKDFTEDLFDLYKWIKEDNTLKEKEKEIYLFGWSEGGVVALNLLNYEVDISGIISFGQPLGNYIDLSMNNTFQWILDCEGDTIKAQAYKNDLRNALDEMNEDNMYQKIMLEVSREIEGGIKSESTQTFPPFYFYQLQEYIEKANGIMDSTKLPILILQGEKDKKLAFENESHKDYKQRGSIEFFSFPNTDHFMYDINTVSFNKSIVDSIHTWIERKSN